MRSFTDIPICSLCPGHHEEQDTCIEQAIRRAEWLMCYDHSATDATEQLVKDGLSTYMAHNAVRAAMVLNRVKG
jgi:hypothetical protein